MWEFHSVWDDCSHQTSHALETLESMVLWNGGSLQQGSSEGRNQPTTISSDGFHKLLRNWRQSKVKEREKQYLFKPDNTFIYSSSQSSSQCWCSVDRFAALYYFHSIKNGFLFVCLCFGFRAGAFLSSFCTVGTLYLPNCNIQTVVEGVGKRDSPYTPSLSHWTRSKMLLVWKSTLFENFGRSLHFW